MKQQLTSQRSPTCRQVLAPHPTQQTRHETSTGPHLLVRNMGIWVVAVTLLSGAAEQRDWISAYKELRVVPGKWQELVFPARADRQPRARSELLSNKFLKVFISASGHQEEP